MAEDESLAGKLPVDMIAKVLDLSPRRVQQLADEGWVPKASHGQYSLVGSVRGYVRYLKASAHNPKVTEQTRLLAAKREVQELKAARLRGDLVRVADVEKGLVWLERKTASEHGIDLRLLWEEFWAKVLG